MGILISCKPRKEVLKGDLDDAIFAADFGSVVAGKAPKVYQDANLFFQNTHPAKGLCEIVEKVFVRLGDPKEAGATIRLSTGFGGGKTHTLITLWQLAKNISEHSIGIELLSAAQRPKKCRVVAIDAGKAGNPNFATHDDAIVQSLWGEFFYQLGGPAAVEKLGEADHPSKNPSEDQIEKILPADPLLVLIDELVVYMGGLSEQEQKNVLGFLNKLASAITKRSRAVLVVTDPATQAVYAKQAAAIGKSLNGIAIELSDWMGRKMSGFDPIGNESARVIVRRLFESVDESAAQTASATYHELYERVSHESGGLIPPVATSADYAKRMTDSYPFHPRLLDSAEGRLGALQEFQKSRGTLRLFARILRTIWESKNDIELITAGDIDWASERIQADLLQRLNRDNFKAAISSDIENHAKELDDGNRGVHVRVASALLLESLPLNEASGLDSAELTLAVLHPEEGGTEPSEALDRLIGVCWHTYPMPGGKGWQFRYEPNILKQIEERMADIPREDARSKVFSEAQGYFGGPTFKLAAWPAQARQVSESADLQLALCEDEKISQAVCSWSDDTEPTAPIPRRFRNAILAVTATSGALDSAIDYAQRLLAADAIERENRTGESGKMVREQLKRILPELQKKFRIQTCRAFDRVVFAGGASYMIEEQFQVPDEQILQKAHGQPSLRKFLEAKNLIYQPGDALDVNRFLKDVLAGATPVPEDLAIYTAKSVHERFLSAPGLRLVAEPGVVRQSIQRALSEGKIVVRLDNGDAFDNKGCVEGPPGKRRRVARTLGSFALDDKTLVASHASVKAKEWLKEDKVGGPGGGPPPPPPPPSGAKRVTAISWDKVIEYAADRPLLRLNLMATTPATAATLASLAHPLSAESLKLSVLVNGQLKDSGTIAFTANDLKLSNPLKPLQIAQTFFNAMADGGTFEATLSLDFGESGRVGLQDQLKVAADEAADDVQPTAEFDKPGGAA